MAVKLYKYSGAGNDFILADLRVRKPAALCCSRTLADEAEADALRTPARIKELCSRTDGFVAADGRTGADGVILLTDSARFDFRMEFFNPDGSSGMMCGNGGRCIVAFAADCGIAPAGEASGEVLDSASEVSSALGAGSASESKASAGSEVPVSDKFAAKSGEYVFEAPDGIHTARILSTDGRRRIVRLKMADACGFRSLPSLNGFFIDTGTRHFVQFMHSVEAVESADVATIGRRLRWHEAFAPQGANINFVGIGEDNVLVVRTFEKGVEAETLACGTGVSAAAVVEYLRSSGSVLPGGTGSGCATAGTGCCAGKAAELGNGCEASGNGNVPMAEKTVSPGVHYDIQTRGGFLQVDFKPAPPQRGSSQTSANSTSCQALAGNFLSSTPADNFLFSVPTNGSSCPTPAGDSLSPSFNNSSAPVPTGDSFSAVTAGDTFCPTPAEESLPVTAGDSLFSFPEDNSLPVATDIYLTGPAEMIA